MERDELVVVVVVRVAATVLLCEVVLQPQLTVSKSSGLCFVRPGWVDGAGEMA